ncbi:imidazole glycerol phosphate synthase subunit HisH [Candidatus Sumerlaeota bacterium]|nr:imidazole glycerol phosphate synthase subunit HisH [Candidatus Sumerlaeota bacterium]
MIAVVDYGLGNLHSVCKALERVAGEEEVCLTEDPSVVDRAERVVVPGVGAFGDTMQGLQRRGMVPALHRVLGSGRPFLGICMGMQALFAASEESPGVEGLGFFPGTLRRFPHAPGLKVPHMGWNALSFPGRVPLFEGLDEGTHVYFVHSYFADLSQPEIVAASSEHGLRFAAAVARPPVYGTQFHPEKSQRVGLRILENFVSLR